MFSIDIKATQIITLPCGCQQFKLVFCTRNYAVSPDIEVGWWHSITSECNSPTRHNFDRKPKAKFIR